VNVLEAAGSATKPVWLTVECTGCGKRSRVQARVPDVRTSVSAIELLLCEGLDRPATAKEVPSPRMPANVAAPKAMGWEEMQVHLDPNREVVARIIDGLALVRVGGAREAGADYRADAHRCGRTRGSGR
jgi:hypothetical protein